MKRLKTEDKPHAWHTLYFAGEAADVTGNNGTVHGAIASARRAVAEITKSGKASAAD